MYKIFVDIDGVLADFDKTWFELFGEKTKDSFDRQRWTTFVTTRQFENLDLMPDASALISHLSLLSEKPRVSVQLLGSTGGYDFHGTVQEQKLYWLRLKRVPFAPIFVPGKRYKQWHATSSSILIDDHEKNIQQFNDRGGIGILHTSAADTIEQLKRHLKL